MGSRPDIRRQEIESERDRGIATSKEREEINMTENFRVPKADVTYGQLDKVLRSFGFKRHELDPNGKGIRYDHEKAGTWITLPLFPEEDHVLVHHLNHVRSTLNDFGIAAPSVFEAKLQKAG